MVKPTDPIVNIILTYTTSFTNALKLAHTTTPPPYYFADVNFANSIYTLTDSVATAQKTFSSTSDLANFVTNGVISYLNAYMMPKYFPATTKFKLLATVGDIDTFTNSVTGNDWTVSQADFNAIIVQHSGGLISSLNNCIVINFANSSVDYAGVTWFPPWVADGNYLGLHQPINNTIFSFININATYDLTGIQYALCQGQARDTITLGLSHELAEIAVDPWGINWLAGQMSSIVLEEVDHYPADTTDPNNPIPAFDFYWNFAQNIFYIKEVGDPVEWNVITNYCGGSGSTGTGGIYMSMTDFVFANYFDKTNHTLPFCLGQTLDIANPTTSKPTIYMTLYTTLPIDNMFYDFAGPGYVFAQSSSKHEQASSSQTIVKKLSSKQDVRRGVSMQSNNKRP